MLSFPAAIVKGINLIALCPCIVYIQEQNKLFSIEFVICLIFIKSWLSTIAKVSLFIFSVDRIRWFDSCFPFFHFEIGIRDFFLRFQISIYPQKYTINITFPDNNVHCYVQKTI